MPVIAAANPLDNRTSTVLFFLGLLLYGASMPHKVTFEDSGLFLQVCHFGGIAHPPGYPLFTLLCTPLFSWLPFNPVLIGNSISAFFGTLTAVVFYRLLRQWQIIYWLAVLGAVLLLLARAFWSQAIIIEVYTLNTFLCLLCIYLAILFQQSNRPVFLLLLIFVFSLGIANHWPLTVLCFPGLLVLISSKWREILRLVKSPRFFSLGLILFILGLTPYLWLILVTPEFSYSGPINTSAEFFAYFFRHAYAAVDQQVVADAQDTRRYMLWSLTEVALQDGLWFAVFIIPGLLAHQLWGTHTHLGLMTILLCHTVLLSLLLGFDFDYLYQSVMSTYLLFAHICFLIFVIGGIQLLITRLSLKQTGKLAAAGVVSILVVATFVDNGQLNYRATDHLAHDYARVVLESLEHKAILVTAADPQTFPIGYLHNVLGTRADVTLHHGSNLFFGEKFAGGNHEHYKQAIELAQRPVYSINVSWLRQGTDYGIYLKDSQSQMPAYELDPRLNAFVSELATLYIEDKIVQPHDRYFSQQLLYAASLQLIGYSTLHPLPDAELNLLLGLQTTFPGTLATLAIALSNNQFNPSRQMLLNLAQPHINSTPIESNNFQESLFYYYLCLLESDEAKSRQYLKTSAELYPSVKNPGYLLWFGK